MGSGRRCARSQVFQNLLDNAVKFTNWGGRVTVRLAVDHSGRAGVAVDDSGIGIEPELLPRLFTFSARLTGLWTHTRGSRSRPRPGERPDRFTWRSGRSGQQRAGQRGVHRPTPGGTNAAACCRSRGPQPHRRPHGASLRVLIVEDQRDTAASLRMVLEMLGHERGVAYTGPDGVCGPRNGGQILCCATSGSQAWMVTASHANCDQIQ